MLNSRRCISHGVIYKHSLLQRLFGFYCYKWSQYGDSEYCKRANIRGGFNFTIFAVVDDFSTNLNPPR